MTRPRLPRLILPTVCDADWDGMRGDARVRRCQSCDKNVYDITRLGRRQVAELIAKTEGALPCIRAFRRPDGRIVLGRCRVQVARAAAWVRFKVALAASILV